MYGPDGQALYGWRVLLLPYIEEEKRFEEFKKDEAWDSPHNMRLIERMPGIYEASWQKIVKVPANHTVLRVFTGKGTPFEGGVKLDQTFFPKGIDNTLHFVEAGDPIPWTKPDEIEYDPKRPIVLKGLFRDGFRACTAASAGYRFIQHDTPEAELRGMIVRNREESINP